MSSNSPPLNDCDDIERASIDQEIASLLEDVRILRSRRNCLAPISRLPPELIARIFLFFQEDGRDAISYSYYKWTIILQVCSAWRKIAVSSPGLWTRIVQRGTRQRSEWAVISLYRSGAAPLYVYISEIELDAQDLSFVLSILSEMYRIRTMNIRVLRSSSVSPNWNRLQEYLEKPAPIMREVAIRSYSGKALFPQFRLFGGHAPALSDLSLFSFHLDWRQSPFQRLTHLYLAAFDGSKDDPIPFYSFIDLLSATRCLQDLQVGNWSVAMPISAPHHLQMAVSLHHLTDLSLFMSWEACVAFFSIVFIPSRTSININAEAAIRTHREDLFMPMSRSMSTGVVQFTQMDLILSEKHSRLYLHENSALLVSVRFDGDDTVILPKIQQSFQLDNLHSLTLRHHAKHNQIWKPYHFVFPQSLCSLTVEGLFVGWFLADFQNDPGCLPNLKSLSISLDSDESADVRGTLKVLQWALRSRQGMFGSKLKELHVRRGSHVVVQVDDILDVLGAYTEVIMIQ